MAGEPFPEAGIPLSGDRGSNLRKKMDSHYLQAFA
jgi:hypothetical protein